MDRGWVCPRSKDRLPLLISIVISPVVDKLQEYGKEQWIAEELLQLGRLICSPIL